MFTKMILSASLLFLFFGSVMSTVTTIPTKVLLVGSTCSPDGPNQCANGLACEDNICKIIEAGACHGTPDFCISGKYCVGKFSNDKKCKSLMPPGGECKTDPYWFCETDLVCENRICKIPAGGDCTNFTTGCKSGMICVGDDDKKVCAEPVLVGGKCESDRLKVCNSGLICQDSTCKIPEGESCIENTADCSSGLNCVEIGEGKQCQKPSSVGGECENALFKVCTSGLICEENVCKIPTLGTCTIDLDGCAFGLSCFGTDDEKKCTKPIPVGGECETDPFQFCESALVCLNNMCKIAENSACTDNQEGCVDGLRCVGSNDVKQCTKPSPVGGDCEISMFSLCEDDLKCEENQCKIREGSVCTGAPNSCSSGLSCVGANEEKRCKTLMPVGGKCRTDPFWICEKGLVCQKEHCRIPSKGLCLHAPKFCARGTKCVGTNTKKRCKKPMRLGGRCGTDPFWVCGGRLLCDNNRCKLPKGSLCKRHPTKCLSGTKCIGNQRVKRCKKPMQDGQKCGTDPFWVCDDGLKCHNHRCKNL